MGFVGRLEDLSVSDLFQILSLNKRTGKLLLTRRREQGTVVFYHGGILYCHTNTGHETLGGILINRRKIDEATLLSAVEIQQNSEGLPLGKVLVGMGAIDAETLHEVIYEQIRGVLSELLGWDSGMFQFEALEIKNHGDLAFDASEFLLEEGLRPEGIVLDLLAQFDESKAGKSTRDEAPREDGELRKIEAGQTPKEGRRRNRGFTSLKSIMLEMRQRPMTFTGEISLMILRYMAEVVNRGVLFARRGDSLVGMGQFGIEIEGVSADERVRELRVSLKESSSFAEVVESGHPYRGRLSRTAISSELIRQLGGMAPREVVILPILAESEVVAVVYGDNLPRETPIGPTEGLELLMLEAGLMIEKRRLEEQVELLSSSSGFEE